ncbi:MAG: GatB/YqeY domain-containing protein [Planctomycetota bacterium]
MLIDTIKSQIKDAMRAKDTATRDLLKVVLGDLQLNETRKGSALTDEEAQKDVKKVIKGNRETIAAVNDPEVVQRMEWEISVLEKLLPQTLSVDEIVAALGPVAEDIKAAGNDGQATGVAMKHLRPTGAVVEGKDVAAAVRQIRG